MRGCKDDVQPLRCCRRHRTSLHEDYCPRAGGVVRCPGEGHLTAMCGARASRVSPHAQAWCARFARCAPDPCVGPAAVTAHRVPPPPLITAGGWWVSGARQLGGPSCPTFSVELSCRTARSPAVGSARWYYPPCCYSPCSGHAPHHGLSHAPSSPLHVPIRCWPWPIEWNGAGGVTSLL